jgi:arylsulfatase A-like enzyme
VVVDTLRADRLGVYGFPAPVSPNLDALAARGVVFERAIAASTKTAPSVTSLLTSRWVGRHSVGALNGTTRLEGSETLAERLHAAGYATAAFIGNMVLKRRIGLDAGFDVYDDELPAREANRPDFFERPAGPTTERALARQQTTSRSSCGCTTGTRTAPTRRRSFTDSFPAGHAGEERPAVG